MSIRNLDALFHPKSVAVVGATERPGSIGAAVTRNALAGGFAGPIHLVNLKGGTILGRKAVKRVRDLATPPDLAVIATPADTVPGLVGELGRAGTRAAVVITAGFGEGGDRERDAEGARRRQAVLDAAKPHLLRVVGPNCVGFLAPSLGLNLSFAPAAPKAGKIAFVGQSGAVLTAVIDWAADRGIGFSYLVSTGNMADVDFGDVVDYLALDHETRAILLYIEGLTEARKFMSAARAAARLKPVVALKAGRHAEGARAAKSHTGAMAGADAVYDAAFRRAGILRVYGLGELFDATEVLGLARPPRTDGLAIVSNGGGFGVLATDDLGALGGRLAKFGAATMAALDKALPPMWSHANPVDIIGDADAARYLAALGPIADEPDVGAVLVMNAPTALASSEAAAKAVAGSGIAARVPLIACWLGGHSADAGRRVLEQAGIAAYDTPLRAVRAFRHLVEFGKSQAALMETPPSIPDMAPPDRAAAERIIEGALAEGRAMLTEPEAKAVIAAFGIPTVPTEVARDETEAVAAAERLGYPVALKILSREITHKSDVGGVRLGLDSAESVAEAAREMRFRVAVLRRDARLDGFTVSRMIRRPEAYELILGAAEDPLFGPVLMFGQGGTAAEIIGDRAMALPPLNLTLAGGMMSRTRIDRLLRGFRDRKPAARREIALTLVKLSRLVAELDTVAELDINPLLADHEGVLALDARIAVRPARSGEHARRFAIRPYPSELERTIEHTGERYRVRPIQPEDEPALVKTFGQMTPEDVRMRFFAPIRSLSHEMAARLTQIDYHREMALVLAEAREGAAGPKAEPEFAGIVRLAADPDFDKAEFAIIVLPKAQGRGLGRLLMELIIAYAKSRGIRQLFGDVLAENHRMLQLARDLGFTAKAIAEGPSVVRVTKTL
jgi:acetyltransferase